MEIVVHYTQHRQCDIQFLIEVYSPVHMSTDPTNVLAVDESQGRALIESFLYVTHQLVCRIKHRLYSDRQTDTRLMASFSRQPR